MLIPVTEEHIREGVKNDIKWSPVALALRDQFPGIQPKPGYREPILVTAENLYWGSNKFPIPKEVNAWLDRFDAGKKVKPFTFKIPARTC